MSRTATTKPTTAKSTKKGSPDKLTKTGKKSDVDLKEDDLDRVIGGADSLTGTGKVTKIQF